MVISCTSGQPQVTHSTSRALRAVPGQIRLDPGKLIERTHTNQTFVHIPWHKAQPFYRVSQYKLCSIHSLSWSLARQPSLSQLPSVSVKKKIPWQKSNSGSCKLLRTLLGRITQMRCDQAKWVVCRPMSFCCCWYIWNSIHYVNT